MRRRWLFSILSLLVGTAASLALAPGGSGRASAQDAELRADETLDDWEHRTWIAKAARTLNGGVSPPLADIDALAPLSREEIVERLMARPDFGDTLLDFNMFYLGFRPMRLYRLDGGNDSVAGARVYDFMVYTKPQAIAAAQAVLSGGDYFTLFAANVPKYMAPVGEPMGRDPATPRDAYRLELFQRGMAAFDAILAKFRTTGGGLDKGAGCVAYQTDNDSRSAIENMTQGFGFLFTYFFDFSLYPNVEVNIGCGDVNVAAEEIVARLERQRLGFQQLFAMIPELSEPRYRTRSVMDIRPLANPDALPMFKGDQFGFVGFWQHLPNSSTNYNRKRAAYMLKTYFCDDLTPLGVVVPGDDSHTDGRHASDPGCQSCHYKLDPMAGFFKDKGLLGIDFGRAPFHVFDDNAQLVDAPLAAYRASWPTVGFIRSTRDAALNDYGTTIDDLFGILRRAPEVKQCLVRRMAEYVLGKDQVFDGGWLDHLSANFAALPSSAAVKATMRDLVLSKTFRQEDPEPDQCYDRYPDVPPANALPCAVAHVVRNNCAGCHRSTGPNVGGLDLSRWVEVGRDAAGQPVMSFPHLDASGAQVSRATTFARLTERLNSSDPQLSMPKNRDMNAVEKARLYLWVTEQ